MRKCNFHFPTNNKAAVTITSALYDRRALDCTAPLALVNSLSHLHYLINTSARIRELVSTDGGFNRLIHILRNTPVRVQHVMNVWKWSLAFNCLVAAGIRGTKEIRVQLAEMGILKFLMDIMEAHLIVFRRHMDFCTPEDAAYRAMVMPPPPAQAVAPNEPRAQQQRPPPPPTVQPHPQEVQPATEGNRAAIATARTYHAPAATGRAIGRTNRGAPTEGAPDSDEEEEADESAAQAQARDMNRFRNMPVHSTTRNRQPHIDRAQAVPGRATTAFAAATLAANGVPRSPGRTDEEESPSTTQTPAHTHAAVSHELYHPTPRRPEMGYGRPARSELTPPPQEVPTPAVAEPTAPVMMPAAVTMADDPSPHNVMSRPEDVFHCLQLLGYMTKYLEVREHMHRDYERDLFAVVQEYTHRNQPRHIRRWAAVVMRNGCLKDEAPNGLWRCANLNCLRWETFTREFAKCRQCRKAKYCGRLCQQEAWRTGHQFWCNEAQIDEHNILDEEAMLRAATAASLLTAQQAADQPPADGVAVAQAREGTEDAGDVEVNGLGTPPPAEQATYL